MVSKPPIPKSVEAQGRSEVLLLDSVLGLPVLVLAFPGPSRPWATLPLTRNPALPWLWRQETTHTKQLRV